MVKPKRGELWLADLGDPVGAEAGYERPVVIVQDDYINLSRVQTVVVVPLTSNMKYRNLVGNVFLSARSTGLQVDSVAQTHLIQALNKDKLIHNLSVLSAGVMSEIEIGMTHTLGLIED